MRSRLLLAAALLAAGAALAQLPAPVPPALQATTFDKIFAFDRALGDRAHLKVLVVYGHDAEPGGKESAAALQRAFSAARIPGEPVPLAAAAGRLGPRVVVYLLPGADTPDLLRAAAAAHSLTIAGEAGPAEQGRASVGLAMRGDKADIVVNLERVAEEGHDFNAQLLKFARVVQGGAASAGPAGGAGAPVLVALSKPEYPELARRLRVEGDVVMRLAVDENGKVAGVELVKGLGRGGVDEAAMAAARKARFRPASRNGVAVPGTYLLTIPFRM